MDRFKLAARVVLGLIFVIFGLNGFLNFLPPPELSQGGYAFVGALVGSGYLMKLVTLVQLICGVLLLANQMIGLALVMLSPIIVNIFCFHAFLDTKGLPMAVILVILNAFLGYAYWDRFKPLFQKG